MKLDLSLIDSNLFHEWQLFILLRKDEKWFTTKEIQTELGISSSLTLKIISQLEEDLSTFYSGHEIVLQTNKGKGFRLSIEGTAVKIRQFLIYLVENTITFQLFLALLDEDYQNAESFSLRMYTSDATIRRVTNKLRDGLKPYSVEITKGNSTLVGKETHVRLLINIIFWKIYGGAIWPFATVNEKHIHRLAQFMINDTDVLLTPIQMRQLEFFIAIGIIRRRHGHFVEKEDWWDTVTHRNPVFDRFQKKVRSWPTNTLEKNSPEMIFLYFMLLIQSENISTFKLLEENYIFNKAQNTALYQSTHAFSNSLSVGTLIQELHPAIIFSFSYHLFAKLFPAFTTDLNGYPYFNRLNAPTPNNYLSNTKKVIQKLIKHLYRTTSDSLFLSETYLTSKYGLLFLHYQLHYDFEPQIKLKLATDLTYFANKHIEKTICSFFLESFNIVFLDDFSPEEPDILLTNLDYGEYPASQNTIIIQRTLSSRNINYIGQQLSKIHDEKTSTSK
ncbi:mga helix-turn-helix domain-containing protein [Listeria fleischmannii 1991]|uniref:Mga helix-turn-helix domain-containing protein n=1 Tax=Listeria fleischmannii 1991 TaxID=1430899 RepID=A0A0J8J2B2_9LIST|nr:helix-turn-helix domain-containing protein [Listeria fleischmannii]EMG28367.1 hypothetical protein LFLEISCH_05784 [Listeria fleischmannii subsp. fleischmannii LU2006-1]KMT58456.1 mga helix-turn-helix domain-containing protein [Listeria fleischmannii 1991]